MFYSKSLLSGKGPLGNIWVAAYCYKKLRREQVTGTNISSAIDKIIPDLQLSYRVLAHLLLGIVRIFSKKVDYLVHDCNEVLIRLRKTFLTSQQNTSKEATGGHHYKVSLPEEVTHGQCHSVKFHEEGIHTAIEAVRAACHDMAITVPKNFELDSFDLGVPEEHENVSTREPFSLAVEDELSQPAFRNERHDDNMIALSDFYAGCFTPVEEVISSGILDIHLEVSELQQASKSEEKQKLEGDLPSLEECANHSNARRSLKLDIHSQELEGQAEQKELQQAKQSDSSHAPPEGYEEVRTPVNRHSKRKVCTSEATSPELAVTTPAIKERPWMLRKRKFLFDETIVLPNQILRQWIHDGSSLICKRRKTPHTFLDAWKAQKLSNIETSLMEPLIPCIPFDYKAISFESSAVPSAQKKSADSTPHKSDFETTEVLAEPEQRDGLFPSVELLPSISSAEVPSAGKADEEIFVEPFTIEKPDTQISLGDREFSFTQGESDNQDGCSTRTRSVARYFSRCFEREGKGALTLSKILEGNSRTHCAQLFYETLVLRCCGFVGVEQESPYSDIIVSSNSCSKKNVGIWPCEPFGGT